MYISIKLWLVLSGASVPHRTTLSRRYKTLYPVIQELIAFVADSSQQMEEKLSSKHLNEDQSLFKAQGSVWHPSDRKATQGVILVVPALRWKTEPYVKAYRRFIKADSEIATILRQRKTTIEPIFDLISKLLGTLGKQKQLFRQGIHNVRTHLALGVFSLQIAMLANSVWDMPFRTISCIKGVFA